MSSICSAVLPSPQTGHVGSCGRLNEAGNITVGLVMGLLQFVSTFAITTFYVRYANKNLDPDATRIRESIEGADR